LNIRIGTEIRSIEMSLELQQIHDFAPLAADLRNTADPISALARFLVGRVVEQGLWRFYSVDYPPLGLQAWNQAAWRKHWPSHMSVYQFWGEDAFGNQLALQDGRPNAFIWNHEDGSLVDLELDPLTLLDSVASAGLDWIDFYCDGSIQIARSCKSMVSLDTHLHWKQLLILGGPIVASNVSILGREIHLAGHGDIWAQIGDLPPGTEIMIR
jgi:hypothetical protein